MHSNKGSCGLLSVCAFDMRLGNSGRQPRATLPRLTTRDIIEK